MCVWGGGSGKGLLSPKFIERVHGTQSGFFDGVTLATLRKANHVYWLANTAFKHTANGCYEY